MPPPSPGPEAIARQRIDEQLASAGWAVQDRSEINLSASRGVAIREFPMASGHGLADYLLFVDRQAVGALEAKKAGVPLSGIEVQAEKYSDGLPGELQAPLRPLPFLYVSTGEETGFVNRLDPAPRTRRLFSVHRPETLAEWMEAESLADWVTNRADAGYIHEVTDLDATRPSTLRARLRHAMPPVEIPNLWPNKVEAIQNLERSLAADRPRALIQMATGSGKTLLAVTALYRLIKFGGARRVLFLVDRANLGEQAEKEFQGYRTPDDNRKFTELYTVQRLTANTVASSATVVISTIQRLYSLLRGEEALAEIAEEESQFLAGEHPVHEPPPVAYNPALPPEFFDVIVIDECHRSIYTLWRQVLEYFDAHLIGLTATPAEHTYGFFQKNLVMEYPHARAVADGVNVDFEIYRISTRISEEGGRIEASTEPVVGLRDRRTRQLRWTAADEEIRYDPEELDHQVVAKDQIRTIVRTFRERLFTDLFPGRREVPKTLIFAKNDSHAEDIVEIVREEFGEGNDFCRKITYRTTGARPADLIQEFRNSFQPRIAVTVDMIATGTDIRPVEIVVFLRAVQSRVLFEQMKGRGVRVVDPNELRAVTPSARAKTHFVIVDCVGITDTDLADTQPLERKPGVSFRKLLDHVAVGGTDPELYSSLASRLARLDRRCDAEDRKRIRTAAGVELPEITGAILRALDPDVVEEHARDAHAIAPAAAPAPAQLEAAQRRLLAQATRPLAENPELRATLLELKRKFEQVIDEVSQDELLFAGPSEEARERALALTRSFEEFLAEKRDEIEALQFFYSQPYGHRLRFREIKTLAAAIQAPPRSWTPESLWRAYELLDRGRVRGAAAKRLLTDVVALVRYALHQSPELVPYPEQVAERFRLWLSQQENRGRRFTPEQHRWLEMIRDHVATSLEVEIADFDYVPFVEKGGLGRAREVFGPELNTILGELNEVLVA